jgi:signal transduction histidine kinase
MKDERTRTQSLKRARAILEDTIEELRTPTLATGHRGVGGVLARALCAVADSYAGMLLNQVHEAHAAERRRLSRELHDRIGYGISVAQRSLELHDVYRDGDPGRAAVRMHTAQQMLGDTIGVVRQIISDLRLVEPVENLEKAIKLFLERAAGPRLSGHVEVNGDEVWASPDVVEEVYLILREALRNVVAHADAASVLVRVDVARGELRACVVDDGCGFDVAAIPHDGTGVLSMRERAALLGATLTLRSRAGRGTRLELLVPLAEDGGTWATR